MEPLKKQAPLKRGAGILLPVTSLPSPYGIGTFGEEAYRFVDFLEEAGQSYWQVLPLGPTSYGDSPYQSFSAFAGNPYFIDFDILARDGLLQTANYSGIDWGTDAAKVNYANIYKNRFRVLRKAYRNSKIAGEPDFTRFCAEDDAVWLDDYSLYMAVKSHNGFSSWQDWPEEIRMAEPQTLDSCKKLYQDDILFWKFCQYEFYRQWHALKQYANKKGIEIIGDIPIYVSLDSADVWLHPSLFKLDSSKCPTDVAGVPPDQFSRTGQLWGNPIYAWDAMARDGFLWWKKRMRCSADLYDITRIDHFIGIVRYYNIPYGSDTAETGEWKKGPGRPLVAAIGEAMGGRKIIAEDLGCVVPAVTELREQAGFPGMKILEFAFNNRPDNLNLPGHYEKNCVVYGGTHDNETLKGFFAHQTQKSLRFARDYLAVRRSRDLPRACIRAGFASAANTAVYQMQDFLGLGDEARMNFPSTIGGNWVWRLVPGELTGNLAGEIRALTELYDRLPKPAKKRTEA